MWRHREVYIINKCSLPCTVQNCYHLMISLRWTGPFTRADPVITSALWLILQDNRFTLLPITLHLLSSTVLGSTWLMLHWSYLFRVGLHNSRVSLNVVWTDCYNKINVWLYMTIVISHSKTSVYEIHHENWTALPWLSRLEHPKCRIIWEFARSSENNSEVTIFLMWQITTVDIKKW